MALNYINGVLVGGGVHASPYGYGRRQFRRLIWLFLTKLCGWTDVDKSGTWDTPEFGAADGATDATDPEKFTSVTGGFSAIDPTDTTKRYYLFIKSGMVDATRNGFYLIRKVYDNNTIFTDKPYCGVHTDGFPLSQTGLSWEVHEVKSTNAPTSNEWFTIGGSGIGGTFHLYCLNYVGVNYMMDRFQISPYDDWDAVTHAWKTTPPAPRITDYAGNWAEAWADSCLVYGVADATHAVFWVRGYEYDMVTGKNYPNLYYFGDMTAFRPGVDTRPVIAIVGQANSNWNVWSGNLNNVKLIDDNFAQITGQIVFPSVHGSSGTGALYGETKERSRYTGRLFRHPLVVVSRTSLSEEIRGTLKSLEGFHYHGIPGWRLLPFGSTRDRLGAWEASLPWNGSKQYKYIF